MVKIGGRKTLFACTKNVNLLHIIYKQTGLYYWKKKKKTGFRSSTPLFSPPFSKAGSLPAGMKARKISVVRIRFLPNFGSGFCPISDPGFCTSNVGRFFFILLIGYFRQFIKKLFSFFRFYTFVVSPVSPRDL